MHETELHRWQHRHSFGTEGRTRAERRTRWVVGVTLAMMVVEIAAGIAFGSMALLADGWHMGTHAAALGVALFAYVYARRHADDPRYSFGTGKVGALAGFASATGLGVVSILILSESAQRLAAPVAIRFDEAIAVAVVGLAVNVVCALLLREDSHSDHGDHHDHGPADHADHADHAHHDHNLRGAYLHVLADALTSVLAIAALATGRLFGFTWMDPLMGLVGSLVIARWSYGLLRDTSAVLLDAELSETRREAIREAIESDGDSRLVDLHVWRVGPRHLAAIVSIVAHAQREPDDYKRLVARQVDLVHLTVEVNHCPEQASAAA